MIVEDEKFIRDGILYLLSEVPGITEIDTACDGEDAWSMITVSRRFPDIVPTDIRMPGMDGLELSDKIREHSAASKIIFISGYEDFAYAKKAISLGASGYVTKPVAQDELLELINRVMIQIRKEEQFDRQQEISCFHEKQSDALLGDILSQIRDNPGGVSLKALSESWGVSPSYISILFKDKTGHNFKDYLLDCRMKRAKELLAAGSQAAEICENLGYSDYDYFSKSYKKYYGESPAEYRRRIHL